MENEADRTKVADLSPYLRPSGAWAFSLGASVGWGSLVVTSSSYLAQAGPLGSILGLLVGMGVMLVIAVSYHFLMVRNPSAGGIYAYARDIFGYDHGVLAAWFLVLTYVAMFWANATALPLFVRMFAGDLFQFGFHYQVFGYDVYLGEVMLSLLAIVLGGVICVLPRQHTAKGMVVLAGIIVLGVSVCFAGAMAQRDPSSFSLSPSFMPGSSPVAQILNIASISSWAFIGFEGISHSTSEFSFETKHSFKVLTAALIAATALYSFLIMLSISAYPPEYGSWPEYIADLGNITGFAGVPAFYAAQYYFGGVGVAILVAVLISLIVTSLVANLVALSRLLYSVARDEVLPIRFAGLNDRGIPVRALNIVIGLSLIIPFLGRTAVGWIVDVTTIGATIIYGFVSACAIKDGRAHGNRVESVCGIIGAIVMVVFGLSLMLPVLFSDETMSSESYFIFLIWSVLGFIVFRYLLSHDDRRIFGKTTFSNVVLLALVLIMSAAWMGRVATAATNKALGEILAFEAGNVDAATLALGNETYYQSVMDGVSISIAEGAVIIAGFCMLSFSVMLSNFNVIQKREEESFQAASAAHDIANTDPLTGVKSKHAYVTREAELNTLLEEHALKQLGVVVCDVNGLKQVNDTMGHKAGDEYIRSASSLICRLFKHSPVYRIGGDEFVVLLQGVDFENRRAILDSLNREVEANKESGNVVIAAGLSVLMPSMDHEVHAVFERADALMYQRKKQLKGGVEGR